MNNMTVENATTYICRNIAKVDNKPTKENRQFISSLVENTIKYLETEKAARSVNYDGCIYADGCEIPVIIEISGTKNRINVVVRAFS